MASAHREPDIARRTRLAQASPMCPTCDPGGISTGPIGHTDPPEGASLGGTRLDETASPGRRSRRRRLGILALLLGSALLTLGSGISTLAVFTDSKNACAVQPCTAAIWKTEQGHHPPTLIGRPWSFTNFSKASSLGTTAR